MVFRNHCYVTKHPSNSLDKQLRLQATGAESVKVTDADTAEDPIETKASNKNSNSSLRLEKEQ